MNLFDHIKNLTQYKNEANFKDDEVATTYKQSRYMINRYISMNEPYIQIVNEINSYPDIPDESHYRYYFNILPKLKVFFNYVKKTKTNADEEIKYIAHYFDVGKKEAEMYFNTLSQNDIDEIINKYKHGRNKLAKI